MERIFFANFADWKRPIFILFIFLILISILLYIFKESLFKKIPNNINFLDCLFFSISMFTTLGYSPYIEPINTFAYFISILLSLMGFSLFTYYLAQYIQNSSARKQPLAKKNKHSYYDTVWFKDFPEE